MFCVVVVSFDGLMGKKKNTERFSLTERIISIHTNVISRGTSQEVATGVYIQCAGREEGEYNGRSLGCFYPKNLHDVRINKCDILM
jgi:hypothetical protein